MSLRGAVFLGVGAMVGAGIFALLGEAGTVAGAAVWVSFLVAGVVCGMLGYALVKLGRPVPVVRRAHHLSDRGRSATAGSWASRPGCGYFAAIVLVGAMVAVSFGDYAALLDRRQRLRTRLEQAVRHR